MIIETIDPVNSKLIRVTPQERAWLDRLLSYKKVWVKKRPFGGIEKTPYAKKFLQRSGTFPSGFRNRIRLAAAEADLDVEWLNGDEFRLPATGFHEPTVPDKTLRPDQHGLITAALIEQRGVLLAPTGSGKTVVMMGLLSALRDHKTLIVTHSTDIVSQTVSELKKHGFDAGRKPDAGIVVQTKQSLVGRQWRGGNGGSCRHINSVTGKVFTGTCNLCGAKRPKAPEMKPDVEEWMTDVDVVIIDESHLFGEEEGQYAAILRLSIAPIKLGLTATMPEEGTAQAMCMEAWLGPVIGEVTHEEAKEAGVICGARIDLLELRLQPTIAGYKDYDTLKSEGIVHNRLRNRAIMTKAASLMADGSSVLIFVNEIEHGRNLKDMADTLEVKADFIYGGTQQEERDQMKAAISSKNIGCVIVCRIWREGVNIPNLGAVILAGAGKARLSTLQTIGRGLRTYPGKDHAVIVDIMDPYRYLAEHFVQRLNIYKQMGWI